MKNKSKRIFWGVSLIIIALLLILSAVGENMGFLDIGGVPVLRIILGGLFLAYAIYEGIKGKISQIFFPIAFTFLLFQNEIGTYIFNKDLTAEGAEFVSPWLVLGVAALLTIGTIILFPEKTAIVADVASHAHDKEPETHTKVKNFEDNIAAKTKDISCAEGGDMKISGNMGSLNVYFTDTEKFVSGGKLIVENNFGAMTLHIPENWKVSVASAGSLGNLRLPESNANATETLNIEGKNNLGNLKIEYC